MYTVTYFKTKKALKQAVANGDQVRVYHPGRFFPYSTHSGTVFIEGSHWYAQATLVDGLVVKVT